MPKTVLRQNDSSGQQKHTVNIERYACFVAILEIFFSPLLIVFNTYVNVYVLDTKYQNLGQVLFYDLLLVVGVVTSILVLVALKKRFSSLYRPYLIAKGFLIALMTVPYVVGIIAMPISHLLPGLAIVTDSVHVSYEIGKLENYLIVAAVDLYMVMQLLVPCWCYWIIWRAYEYMKMDKAYSDRATALRKT